MKVEDLRQKVAELAPQVPEKSDAEWLIAVYVSLSTAERLGYKKDTFAMLPRSERESVNKGLISQDLLNIAELSESEKTWLSGHFFNNALFRMVALVEIALKTLFEQRMHMTAPNNYWWIVDWYKANFQGTLGYVKRARQRVNTFKHEPRDYEKVPKLETLADGIQAFHELLELLSHVVEAEQTNSADAKKPRR